MAVVKRNFGVPYRSIDEFAIRDNLWLIQDGYMDEAGSIYKRPGFTEFADLGTNLGQGLYWWNEEKAAIAISDGRTFKLTDKNGSFTEITGSTSLNPDTRATFTKIADSDNGNADTLFIANGTQIVNTTGGTCSQFPTGVTGSAPSRATHVTTLDGYLLTNDLDNPTLTKYSAPQKPFNFSSGFNFPAQAKTDDIFNNFQNGNLVYVGGADSMEPFYDSGGSIPFLRLNGGLVEEGMVNAYAYATIDKRIFLLNKNRAISTISGNNLIDLSANYSRRIHEISSIKDVEVEVIRNSNGKTFILFSLHDARTTIIYDYSLKLITGKDVFYEWATWDPQNSAYKQLSIRGAIYCPDWNIHLVGDRYSGKIYKLSDDYTTDNGNPIRTEIITGIYGNPVERLRSKYMFPDVRRGDGVTSDPYKGAKMFFQKREDNNLNWDNMVEIDLGARGQTARVNYLYNGGSYYSRQYRILHMDDSKFVLNGLWEDVD